MRAGSDSGALPSLDAPSQPPGLARTPLRGGLLGWTVALCLALVITTAVAVAVEIYWVVTQQGQNAGMAAMLLAGIPLTLAAVGGVRAYVLAGRLRETIAALASAAQRMREGDFFTPIPQVREPELVQLAAELENARTSLHAQLRAASAEDVHERALTSALREPVVTTSADGRIMALNAAATAAFGSLGRVYGRPVQEVLPFAGGEPAAGSEEQLAKYQGSITDALGRTLDVEVTRTTLLEGRLPTRHLYVVHDVTQYAELNRLREQLLYSVAHELRGSLAVLDNSLDIAVAEYMELSARELGQILSTARRTSRRVRVLVEDLLNTGSIQSGRFVVRPEPARIADIVDDALEVVAPIIGRERVQQELPAGDLIVLADRRYARHVLTNLLTNAAKYSQPDEPIVLRVAPMDGEVRVTVEDRGPGIPPEQQARIFEPYYRADDGQRRPGVGLGLAIAKGIVDAHGGRIGLESEVGSGTRVWFTLPAASLAEGPDAARPANTEMNGTLSNGAPSRITPPSSAVAPPEGAPS